MALCRNLFDPFGLTYGVVEYLCDSGPTINVGNLLSIGVLAYAAKLALEKYKPELYYTAKDTVALAGLGLFVSLAPDSPELSRRTAALRSQNLSSQDSSQSDSIKERSFLRK